MRHLTGSLPTWTWLVAKRNVIDPSPHQSDTDTNIWIDAVGIWIDPSTVNVLLLLFRVFLKYFKWEKIHQHTF